MRLIILSLCLLPAALSAAVESCATTSRTTVTPVLELFTSEGCSSCPPADRWLSETLQRHAGGEVIGLSMHVDYWNYLGWKDPFSDARFSARQAAYRQRSSTRGVYTPQLLVSGIELPDWSEAGRFESRRDTLAQQKAPIRLDIAMTPNAASLLTAKINFQWLSPQQAEPAEAWLALTESGLGSNVVNGENSGRQLHHDGVVRAWLGPYVIPAEGLNLNARFTPQPGWRREHLSVVALAQQPNAGRLLQAVAMPEGVMKVCSAAKRI